MVLVIPSMSFSSISWWFYFERFCVVGWEDDGYGDDVGVGNGIRVADG